MPFARRHPDRPSSPPAPAAIDPEAMVATAALAAPPSLLEQVGRAARGRVAAACRIVPALVGAAALALVGLTVAALWQARSADDRARALTERVAAADRARARISAAASLSALPPMEVQLRRLRAHLPPGILLAEAARDGAGPTKLAIDASDPDVLRRSLASDAALRRLRERGQDRRDDGRLRVRLEGDLR